MRAGRGAAGRRFHLLVWVLLMAPAAAAAQAPLDRIAGLDLRNEPLENALRQLQQATGVSLVFSPDLLPRNVRVSCSCARATVAQALDEILADTGLGWASRGTLVTIVPQRDRSGDATSGTILGRVAGAEDGAPVVNALVEIENGRGVLTSRNGSFFIPRVRPGNHRLHVTALGWKQEAEDEAAVVGADTTRVTILLDRDVIPLAALLIQPGTFGLLENVAPGTAMTLTREEIRTQPQLGEDVFRASAQLPGTASGDISTRLAVRGGADREVLVRLDGLELYEPYHVKDWGGALGIVDINILGGVELQSGGFGVQNGNRLTGVFDMTSRRPEGEARTTVGLSISNATFMSRGTFGAQRGAWLFSGRRGFLDLIMGLANEGRRLSPAYDDVFGKVSYQLGSSNRVSVHFLLAGDRFLLRDPELADLDEVDFESEEHSRYGWVTWDAYPDPRLSVKTTGWIGELDRRRDGVVAEDQDDPSRISVSDHRELFFMGLRSELSFRVTERTLIRLGAEGKGLRAQYEYSRRTWSPYVTENETRGLREDTVGVARDPSGHEISTYAAVRIRPAERWTAEAGLRYQAVSQSGDRDLDPRFLAAYELSPRTSFRVSFGGYSQAQGLHELRVGDGETSFSPAEHARQLAVGVDHRLSSQIDLRLEIYRRTIVDQRPVYFNAEQELKVFPEATGDRLRIDPGRGRATGLEFLAERKAGPRWAWAASYALAVAEDRVDGVWIPRPYDQRHTVMVQTTFQPDRRWSLSLGWRFHTGWPATAWSWDVRTLDDGWNIWTQQFGPIRGIRLPAYHRLDLRVTRALQVGRGELQVFVDLFNLYNRTNLGSWDFSGSYEDGALSVERLNGQEMLPLLPTFGFRYEF
jgi:outer membrane receptor protein involved in Fe transport